MKKIILAFILLAFIGCKEEKKEEKKVEIPTFNVSFNLILQKDDKIHLYYTQDGTVNFNEDNSSWVDLKGSNTPQTITFKLPQDVFPTNLRVDFGSGVNELQSDVDLKSFTMEYAGKKVLAEGNKIFEFFYINESNTKRLEGTTILKKLDKKQAVGPMLYPHTLLTEKAKELVKK